MCNIMTMKVDNLFYRFENDFYNKDDYNEYLSPRVNKILAFDEWFNSLDDESIAEYLDVDIEEVEEYVEFVNKGITEWLGGK